MKVSEQSASERRIFEILVREHHRMALVYARSLCRNGHVAEDLAQDAFLTARLKIAKFDVKADFGAWLRGIILNKYREWVRQSREVPLSDGVIDALSAQLASWTEFEPSHHEILSRLTNCLKKLPEKLDAVIDRFYFKNHSGADIAAELEIEATVVWKRLERARSNLEKCIKGQNNEA